MNAKTSFKKTYGFARKNLSELQYRSEDINGSVDIDAFEGHLAHMLPGRTGAPLPAVAWSAVCAVAYILCRKDAQQTTAQERLEQRRFLEKDSYEYN